MLVDALSNVFKGVQSFVAYAFLAGCCVLHQIHFISPKGWMPFM